MIIKYHKELAAGRWQELSLAEQMGNIGSEVSRASRQKGKDEKLFWLAVEKALELFDLTLEDLRWKGRRQEIARAREVFCDAVYGGKLYKSSLTDLVRYFDHFALAARNKLN
ncbi:MAG: hypothetical protein CO001_01445 [Candidatus Portnoybacteria bacterium CG_4_8_14_3_um_filter_40_10]|uniref:Uncharacterized protein n=4 Tax=Candidatus Portnoyibacteriota TaxID=1817913 RepID=A0A2M7IIP0_9BACT|nr:MAG: hypothetical protein COV84_02070 [Candidatus Portnoybacteria bacterium CG11_big_fil_rev_8_21_14_0_20_40_15]PIS30641.1 MAG: hypothetical protein COT41_03095 [Candidatus Portnoybacteria bacterium CG08_land_8_20_14_0_20_40_83]PIW76406.1 MAG: hypothetical protein CO001_01445 [Candidatus Portnoybacteria bacterium CG_4_8_14_3_um_filter_40_10]PIY74818.1 MAG: hypothetical protein COY85_02105 [Candidatus Portnoybacteria bacterium CG_4_10_14_0_8_um_filter_40_50]PJA64503.1 MAG: hypothetical protei